MRSRQRPPRPRSATASPRPPDLPADLRSGLRHPRFECLVPALSHGPRARGVHRGVERHLDHRDGESRRPAAPARGTRHARQRQCVRRAGRHRALHGWPRVRGDRAGRRASRRVDARDRSAVARRDRAAVVRERRALLRQAGRARRRRSAGRHAARRAGDALFGADDRAADRIAGRGRRDLRRRPAGAESAVREFVSRLRAGGHRAHLSRRRRHARRGAPGRPAIARARRAAIVVPLRLPGLLEYQANWRHRLEERP